jgi:hypothetical protein
VKRLATASLALGLELLAGSAFAQCAMCKTLLTNSPEGRAMSGRFNIAILVMLLAPYLVASGVLLAVFRDSLRARFQSLLALRRRRSQATPA